MQGGGTHSDAVHGLKVDIPAGVSRELVADFLLLKRFHSAKGRGSADGEDGVLSRMLLLFHASRERDPGWRDKMFGAVAKNAGGEDPREWGERDKVKRAMAGARANGVRLLLSTPGDKRRLALLHACLARQCADEVDEMTYDCRRLPYHHCHILSSVSGRGPFV